MIFESDKLVEAKAALKQHERAQRAVQTVYKAVTGGVTVYFGQKKVEAEDAFKSSGRKDKELYKIENGFVTRIG